MAAVAEGDASSGKQALGINAGTGKDAGGKEVSAQVVSSEFAIEPGQSYRLAAALRANRPGVLVDEVKLEKVELLDEWASWQALGFDGKSAVCDPLFVDRDKDDYRLQPESPALKLGFKPIPIENIGPYADELRASWPIVEAEGAREKPLNPW